MKYCIENNIITIIERESLKKSFLILSRIIYCWEEGNEISKENFLKGKKEVT